MFIHILANGSQPEAFTAIYAPYMLVDFLKGTFPNLIFCLGHDRKRSHVCTAVHAVRALYVDRCLDGYLSSCQTYILSFHQVLCEYIPYISLDISFNERCISESRTF